MRKKDGESEKATAKSDVQSKILDDLTSGVERSKSSTIRRAARLTTNQECDSTATKGIVNSPVSDSKTMKNGGKIGKKRKKYIGDEDDDDFVNVPPSSLLKEMSKDKSLVGVKRKKLMKTKKTEKGEFRTLRSRYPPIRITELLPVLSNKQKECIKSIGFGSTLEMKVGKLAKQLGYWIVDNYNPESNSLYVNDKQLVVTRERVHEVYGIPMGKVSMTNNAKEKRDKKFVKLWKSQFPKSLDRIRICHVLEKIKKDKEAGELFVLNFLVLYVNVMIQTTPMGEASKKFLEYIPNLQEIKNLDWCGFVVSSLKASKNVWDREDVKCFYTGPIVFLLMFYLECTLGVEETMKMTKPSVCFWTTDMLIERQAEELENGGFGGIRSVEANETKDKGQKLLEELIWELDLNFKAYRESKNNIEKLLASGVEDFPDSEELHKRMRERDMLFGFERESYDGDEVEHGDRTPVHNPTYEVNIKDDGTDDVFLTPFTQILTPVTFDSLEQSAVDTCETISKKEMNTNQTGRCLDSEKTPNMTKNTNMGGILNDSMVYSDVDDDVDEQDVIDVIPLSYIAPRHTKRVVKPTLKAQSPYYKKVVDANSPMKPIEITLSGWVFAGLGSEWDLVFETKCGDTGYRGMFESMIPGAEVHGGVVDLWSCVLNDAESRSTNRKSGRRMFISCSLLSNMVFDERFDRLKRAEYFEKRMNEYMENYKEYATFSNVHLVFFPVLKSNHFFLIVFNLKKPSCVLIDNSANEESMQNNYENIPTDLIWCFHRYLTHLNHKKAMKMLSVETEELMMSWRTRKNKIDCGIFLMRHMETYRGQKLEDWEADLEPEGLTQRQQLSELRRKYVTKILLSDLNVHKKHILASLDEYDDLPVEEKRSFCTKEHLERIEERIKVFP